MLRPRNDAVTLTCAVPRSARFEVHPTGREDGSTVAVLVADLRSIVLCECENPFAVLDHIDTVRAVPGVLNVALVYHHAEPRDALAATVPQPEHGARP